MVKRPLLTKVCHIDWSPILFICYPRAPSKCAWKLLLVALLWLINNLLKLLQWNLVPFNSSTWQGLHNGKNSLAREKQNESTILSLNSDNVNWNSFMCFCSFITMWLLCPSILSCFVYFWCHFGALCLHVFKTFGFVQFSLPLPQGGRDAISKNLILREDQLPQKYLYPKNKKKQNKQVSSSELFFFFPFLWYLDGCHFKNDISSFGWKQLYSVHRFTGIAEFLMYRLLQGDAFFPQDDIFIHHTDKRTPFQPPVRKALAVFSGKRNPNDNHFSRSKGK